ncbi:hypothetical protein MTP99_003275 [Tenebrio molitor]|jgi:hypothetical protein|uniref:12 kDa hemolymph protein b n=1 Tax=Tenebrio molitor TaxID=7067 RepID=Q7YWD7_TENMO|nr:12 kDa hemolymph protein b precursor [Tenebrio molitor]KAJ3621106.1 hypothetical protein MTP99_003275 [Tenebrio molitor]
MKLLLCLVLVALVAATYAETPREKLKQHSDACKAESGVSEESLNKVRNREEVDDPKLKEHAFCILKRAGFIDASGEFQLDHIKTKFKENSEHPDKVDALVAKCAVKKDTPQHSSADFFKCVHDNRS